MSKATILNTAQIFCLKRLVLVIILAKNGAFFFKVSIFCGHAQRKNKIKYLK
jgi:hypothetical protein